MNTPPKGSNSSSEDLIARAGRAVGAVRDYLLDAEEERLPKLLFSLSILFGAFLYGFAAHKFQIFPYGVVSGGYSFVQAQLEERGGDGVPWFYKATAETEPVSVYERGRAQDGVTLVSSVDWDGELAARLVDMDGRVIHEWDLDWFKISPDASHVPADLRPNSPPGTHIHGLVMMDDGDIVFVYERMTLVRMDRCGEVKWSLPQIAHHSVYADENGDLWAPGRRIHDAPLDDYPHLEPRFYEELILKVSPDGEVLEEISVFDLLSQNGLSPFLYMTTQHNLSTKVSVDPLHLNDVEIFPSTMAPGAFEAGDIMISLRNVNSVMVFDGDTREAKYVATGLFARQHDPDFIDGNTISVYDNNNIAPGGYGHESRIVTIRPASGVVGEYGREGETRFYSDIMGRHQWLPNGNLLVLEARGGRAFEVEPGGDVVWEYFNIVRDGYVGWLTDVERLAPEVADLFTSEALAAACSLQE